MNGQVAIDSLRVRVVKVGGSLLDWPGLPGALQAWLDINPAAVNVLIAGGGALGDAIRQMDAAHSLGAEAAHWLCIDVLSVTARLLATMLKLNEPASSLGQLLEPIAAGKGPIVFDPRAFLRNVESNLPGLVLPHDWSMTSDSIAARLAQVLEAGELVLLKSCEPPAGEWSELTRLGFVDEHFPQAAAGLAGVRFVNLRGAAQRGTTLAGRD